MPNRDDVATRLQRVDYRLQTCWTQRMRLDEEIAALQRKRDFLLTMDPQSAAPDTDGDATPAPAAEAGTTEQIEVSTSRMLPSVIPPWYRQPPHRRVTADDVLRRAHAGVEQLQGATQEVAKATQSIVTVLDIAKNILNLVGPEGRRQLAQIAQGLFGALSGVAQPAAMKISTATADGQNPEQQQPAGQPDVLGFLAYITSPAFFDMLASFTQPRRAPEGAENVSQPGA